MLVLLVLDSHPIEDVVHLLRLTHDSILPASRCSIRGSAQDHSATMQTYDSIVLGAGSMGSAALYHLAKLGKYHHRREQVDPDSLDRNCYPEDEEILRRAIRRYFPDADGPTLA